MTARTVRLRVVVVPALLVAALQVSGCARQTAAPPPPGGVYISTSAGANFDQSVELVGPEVDEGAHIAQYALGKAHRPGHKPDFIYIAAGTRGVVYSQNGGDTWQLIETPLRGVSDVVLLENDVLVVAGVGNDEQGYVIRSSDQGQSWEATLTVPAPVEAGGFQIFRAPSLPASVVVSIEIDPFNAERVYAGTSLGTIFVGEQSAKTWRTWHTLSGDPIGVRSRSDFGVRKIVPSPHTNEELLVLTVDGDIIRIREGREESISVPQDVGSATPSTTFGDKRVFDVTYVTQAPAAVFAAVEDGAVVSRDRGQTWRALNLPLDQFETFSAPIVTVSPTNPARLLIGIGNVLFRSEDGGKTWNVFSFETASHVITALLIDPRNAAHVVAVVTPVDS